VTTGNQDQITLELLDKSLRRAESDKDAYTLAVLQLEQGGLFALSGKTKMARLSWSEAEAAALGCGADFEAAEAAALRGQLALDAQQWPEASSHLARAAAASGFVRLPAQRRALLLHNLGYAHTRQDQHEQATTAYRKALEVWGELEGEEQAARLQTLWNLSEALLRQKRYADAVSPLRAALEQQRAQGFAQRARAATTAELLGWALHRSEQSEHAPEAIGLAAQLWEQEGQREGLLRCTLDLAEIYLALAERGVADLKEDPAQAGMAALQRWIELVRRENRSDLLLFGWWRLAQARQSRGLPSQAAQALVQAAEVQREAKSGDGLELLRKAAELELSTLQAASEPERAQILERALRLYERVNDTEAAAWCRRQQLDLLLGRDQWVQAAQLLEVMRQAESPSPQQDAALLAHQARVWMRAQRYGDALEAARRALGRLEHEQGELKASLSMLVQALEAGASTS
jgi:tetratricopeptide (TPR) repeat protein